MEIQDTYIDGDEFVVDWILRARDVDNSTEPWEVNVTLSSLPISGGLVQEFGRITLSETGGNNQEARFGLDEMGLEGGAYEIGVNAIGVATQSTEVSQEQISVTIEVEGDGDVSDITVECTGISDTNPDPGDDITVFFDVTEETTITAPTVEFEVILDGPTVTQTDTFELDLPASQSSQSATVSVPFAADPGDEYTVTVGASEVIG